MLRRHQVWIGRLYMVSDAFIIVIAFLLAWVARFKTAILPKYGALSLSDYLKILYVALPAFLIVAALTGLYNITRNQSLRRVAAQLLVSDAMMALTAMSVLYLSKEPYSRAVIALFVILTFLFTIGTRSALRRILQSFRARGFNRKYILIIGATRATERFLAHVRRHPEFGYEILGGVIADDGRVDRELAVATDEQDGIEDLAQHAFFERENIMCLGTSAELSAILQRHIVDHIVLTVPYYAMGVLRDAVQIAEYYGVHTLLIPDFVDVLPSRPRFDEFAGLPIVDTRYTPLDEVVNLALKRGFDLVFSLLVLVVLSPLFALLAILVHKSSPGPIIYRQTRLGKNRRPFTMYKFRTMVLHDADQEGWTVADDPRRTKVGRFMRRMSLDELPQFWNVLRGDMSVIGPRPERPNYAEQFQEDVPRYMVKHRIRPGITGWAQIHGLRGDTSIEERIEYDLRYIENWSFRMDMLIVLRTVVHGFRNRNAY
ncbi:undecaprenyl-phosphate glucose phosphotransferase [Ferroacidibacillus organovorans]|uniref:Undecaprenyl-phosphate glucose phosphotransferase n=1 Tax=Ferroacidibacillus organovorans TaxID=1765683 RepID=A0A1V4ERE7_9BACL|nr:undecaprenyl-phosphate glucose phosphotransferase [Ferroacidibacillus organovorans]OPG15452.1 undecaprenyl-phosphate glucose phosphotransferase [Ferroacidibacillus organovorans]